MSARPLLAQPREEIAPIAPPRRRLRLLERPVRRRKPKLFYALTALLTAALLGGAQMALSIATTQDSFRLADLRAEQRELSLQAQAVQGELTGLSSPQYLAANADALGMVVAGSPSHLRLSDGAVLGVGGSAGYYSTIDPAGQISVRNAIVTDTPLITAPGVTIGGAVAPVAAEDAVPEEGTVAVPVDEPAVHLPPTLTEGLPSPTTH